MFSAPFRTAVSSGVDTSAREWVLEDCEERLESVLSLFSNCSLQGYGDTGVSICLRKLQEAFEAHHASLPELKSPRDWRHERTRRSQMTARSARGVLIIPFCTADSRGLET